MYSTEWTERTAIERILIRCTSRIGYLESDPSLGRVVVQVQIRALVKSMMDGLRSWLIEVVVYISKATEGQYPDNRN